MPHPQAKNVSDKSHRQDWQMPDKCQTNAQREGVGHAWNGLSYKLDHISLMLLSSVSVYQDYSNSIFLLLLLGRLICLNFKTCCFTCCMEEETMSLSVLFYCIWAFLCRCCSFDLSLSCLSPFLLSYGTVSRGGWKRVCKSTDPLWFINEIYSSIFALNPKSRQKYFNYMQSPKSAPNVTDESAIRCNCRIRKSVKISLWMRNPGQNIFKIHQSIHLCTPLFQGYVTRQNVTLTGPLLFISLSFLQKYW